MVETVRFDGGDTGAWRVERTLAVTGEPLPAVTAVSWGPAAAPAAAATRWSLTGVVSSARYTTAAEAAVLRSVSPALGRADSTRAVLVPVRKNPGWWALAQDERRAVLERSGHLTRSLRALPAVARRLHHSRDLGEPFDFLTWFEHAPADEDVFDELLGALRDSEEWRYVDRDVELRLVREPA